MSSELAILLFIGAVAVLGWLYTILRQRTRPLDAPEAEPLQSALRLAAQGDALLVASEHGRLLHINDVAQRWLSLTDGEPNLEFVARLAQPSDSFLELFGSETTATLQIAGRWVEASSHRIPAGSEARTVIVLRPVSSAAETYDLSRALNIVGAAGSVVQPGMSVEQVLQSLLEITIRELPADAGEISLYDPEAQVLTPRGWVGDGSYVVKLAEAGGVYKLGEGITGWIARHLKPALVVDSHFPTSLRPLLSAQPFRSFIGVPLMAGDRLLGTFELASTQPARFEQMHLALLQAAAPTLATAIANAEAYAEQSRRVESLIALPQETLGPSDEKAAIYQALTERVARLLDASIAGVLLYDERRAALVAQEPFYGLPAHVVRSYYIPIPQGSEAQRIFEQGDVWASADLADEPSAAEWRLDILVNAAGVRDILLVPMQIGSRRIGMLQVSNRRTLGGFSWRDEQNLRILAAQASVIVEEQRLFEQDALRESEMMSLQEMTQAFAALAHDTDLFESANAQIARLMGVEKCGVLLYDPAGSRLAPRLPIFGLDDTTAADYQIPLEPNNAIWHMWHEQDHWIANDVATNAVAVGSGLAEFAAQVGVRKTMIVPLTAGGQRIGVLQVSDKINGADFDEKDARVLAIFAAQVAAQIENTRLYREAQQRATEAEAMRGVAELAGRVLTVEDSFGPALEAIARLLDSPFAFINVIDPQTGSLVTHPRNVYGDYPLSEPLVQDAVSLDDEQSVVRSRRPFISNAVADDERLQDAYREHARRIGIRRTASVPLAVGKTSLGELGVCNRARPYTEADLRILETVAPQLAAALDRLRLYDSTGQSLSRRIQELDAISRVTNELAQTLDLDTLLKMIGQEAARVTEASGSTAVLLEATEAASADPKLLNRVGDALGDDLADIEREAALRGADCVLITDYAEQGDMDLRPLPSDARSALAASIAYEERIVGVLHVYSDQPRRFDSQAASFLQTLASKGSLAYGNHLRYIENQAHSSRLRRRVEQLNQIFEIGQVFQHNADTHAMLEAIAFSIQQSVGFDVVLVTLLDEQTGTLHRVAQMGMPLEAFERSRDTMVSAELLMHALNPRYQISDSYFLPIERLSDWAFEGLSALSITYDGKRTMHPRGKHDWRDGDMLLVPLRGLEGGLRGMISLDRPFDGKRPDRSTVEILEIFAHQTTTTLENARLFAQSAQTTEQQSRLNDVLEAIAGTLDPTEIVMAVARGIQRLAGFQRMTFALQDAEAGGFQVARITPGDGDMLTIQRERRADLARTVLGQVAQSHQDKLFMTADPEGDAFDDVRAWRTEDEQVSLIVPLLAGGVSIGALHVGGGSADRERFDAVRPLARRIANLSAVALHNARLFNQAINLRLFNESVVQSIQQGIIVLDKSGLVMTVNDYMKRRFGWGERSIRQDLFTYRPALKPILAEPVRQVIEQAEPQELREQQVHENGLTRIENFYLYPLLASDSVRGVVLLVEDITERYHLERDLATRVSQITALTDASSQLVATLDRESVTSVMFDAMARVLPYDAMALWRISDDGLELEAVRGDESLKPGTSMPLTADSRLQQIVATKRALTILAAPDQDESEWPSWLGVPMVRQDGVIGIIVLTKREADFYDSIAEQAASAFANQVAVALQNAALFAETSTQMERLQLINRVSLSLAQSLDTENILEIALREISTLLGGNKARAFVFERDLHAARAVVDYPRGEEQPNITFDVNDSAALRHAYGSPAPLIIGDVRQLPRDHPLYGETVARGLAAYMVVPLLVGGQTGGLFEIEFYDHTQTVDSGKIELALLIANQASIAVLNANLLEQMMVRTRELETLLEAAQATSFTLDLDEVLQSTVRLTVQALDMDDCLLMLYDNIEEELEVMVDFNRSGLRQELIQPGTSYDLFQYLNKRKAMQELNVIIKRVDGPTNDVLEIEDMRARGVVTRIFVPLKARDEGIGLLQVDSSNPLRVFTHRESRMAQALGAQAAIAIENARLSTETANQVAQSLVINDLSRAISSTMDIDIMIRIVRDQVPLLTDAADVYMALYDPKTELISFPMAVHRGQEYQIPSRPLGHDEVSFIIKNRRPLPLGGENPNIDEVRRNLGIVNGEGDAKRYLGVPLIAGDKVVGVLAVHDDEESRPFGLNDQRILTTIGTQLGATIQNAQLFEEINERVRARTLELQQERDRLDALYRVTSELVATQQDMTGVLNHALGLVSDSIGADEGVMLIYDVSLERLYCHASVMEAVDPQARAKHPADMLGEWLMQKRQALVIPDLHKVPFWNQNLPGAEGWLSAVAAILGTPEDEKGVVIFLSRSREQFNDAHLKLVSAAAYQLGAALKDAELVTYIKDQNEQLNQLVRSEREERGKNAAILLSIADGVVVIDVEGRITLFNDAAARILDAPRSLTEDQTLTRVAALYGEGQANWARALNQWVAEARLRTGGRLTIERYPLGEHVINAQLSPVMIGESVGTVAVFRDITRDVEVERMKSEFIANVSHELRTPLTSIKGYTDLMSMGVGGQMSEQQERFMATIRENTERMTGLVNDLLRISTIDAGEDVLTLEPVALVSVIDFVLDTLSQTPEHINKHINLSKTIEPAQLTIEADRLKLTLVLTNIIDNAYNFTPNEGKIDVTANLMPDGERVVIAVKDNGVGIPEALQEKVWDRFVRSEQHALVMNVSGTGLGLPIARQYVEMHRGRIWFETAQNVGTTFYVELPVSQKMNGAWQTTVTEAQKTED
jgi:PAS domain S-box-containing protein